MMAREQTHYLAETECESVLAAEQSKDFDPEKIMTESLLVGEEGEVVVILPLKILDGEVQPGSEVRVDADAKTGEMKFQRETVKAGAA